MLQYTLTLTKYYQQQGFLMARLLRQKASCNERYAHVDGHAFDPDVGLFAGLNVPPSCTVMATLQGSLEFKNLGMHFTQPTTTCSILM